MSYYDEILVLLMPCIRKNQLFLLHLITSYFGGKKGISGNKTSCFLLMCTPLTTLGQATAKKTTSAPRLRGEPLLQGLFG